jgi:transcription termination factor NusB
MNAEKLIKYLDKLAKEIVDDYDFSEDPEFTEEDFHDVYSEDEKLENLLYKYLKNKIKSLQK